MTVVDARPAPDRAEAGFDGRAYALAIASTRLLTAIGVWGAVADKAQPILEIKASDGRAGEGAAPFFLHFDHAEIEEGPMGHHAGGPAPLRGLSAGNAGRTRRDAAFG